MKYYIYYEKSCRNSIEHIYKVLIAVNNVAKDASCNTNFVRNASNAQLMVITFFKKDMSSAFHQMETNHILKYNWALSITKKNSYEFAQYKN